MICDKELQSTVLDLRNLISSSSLLRMTHHNCKEHSNKSECEAIESRNKRLDQDSDNFEKSLKNLVNCIKGEAKKEDLLSPETIKKVTGEVLRALPKERK